MRQRPSIRTKMRFDPPPKDGSTIIVARSFELKVYWDRELKQWILTRPLKVETLDDVIRWRRPR
jgi:hypothetical protein